MQTRRFRKAFEFPTKEALETYLKEHPDADKSLHSVKETKEEKAPTEPEAKKPFKKPEEGKTESEPREPVKTERKVPKVDFGKNNYGEATSKAFKQNMANNLGFFDSGKEERKNTSKDKVSKDNVDDFNKSMRDTVGSVVQKYGEHLLSKHTAQRIADHVTNMGAAIKEAVSDGSMSDVSQEDLDEYIREDIKRVLHQDVETKRRSLGDHGIRHVLANAHNSFQMLDQLQKAGKKVTGKDKLMALSIQANHDIGYTVGEAAQFAIKGKAHSADTGKVLKDERDRYDKIWGKDGADQFVRIAETHGESGIDWDNEAVASSVRLADNLSLFGQDKVQDLFIRSPKAMKMACKLRLALNTGDQDSVKNVVNNLREHIDAFDTSEHDKEMMHKAVDEMTNNPKSLDFVVTDVLSRFSGRLTGFDFDKERGTMNVRMKYTPEAQVLDSMFGDKESAKQFKKFQEDMLKGELTTEEEKKTGVPEGKKLVKQKRGEIVFGKDKPSVKLSIEGFDTEPLDAATNDAMKEFAEKTVRPQLMKAAGMTSEPPPEVDVKSVMDYLQKMKSKLEPDEWEALMKRVKEAGSNGKELAKIFLGMPLTKGEKAYLSAKEASSRRASVMTVEEAIKAVQDALAHVSKEARGMSYSVSRDTATVSWLGAVATISFRQHGNGVVSKVSVKDGLYTPMAFENEMTEAFGHVLFKRPGQLADAVDTALWHRHYELAEKVRLGNVPNGVIVF